MGREKRIDDEILYCLEQTALDIIEKQGLVPYVVYRDSKPEPVPVDTHGIYMAIEDGKVTSVARVPF